VPQNRTHYVSPVAYAKYADEITGAGIVIASQRNRATPERSQCVDVKAQAFVIAGEGRCDVTNLAVFQRHPPIKPIGEPLPENCPATDRTRLRDA
jgi:hypothetical protein